MTGCFNSTDVISVSLCREKFVDPQVLSLRKACVGSKQVWAVLLHVYCLCFPDMGHRGKSAVKLFHVPLLHQTAHLLPLPHGTSGSWGEVIISD